MRANEHIDAAAAAWLEAVVAATTAPVVVAWAASAAAASVWTTAFAGGVIGTNRATRPSAEVIDFKSAYAAFRTAGGHATALVTRNGKA